MAGGSSTVTATEAPAPVLPAGAAAGGTAQRRAAKAPAKRGRAAAGKRLPDKTKLRRARSAERAKDVESVHTPVSLRRCLRAFVEGLLANARLDLVLRLLLRVAFVYNMLLFAALLALPSIVWRAGAPLLPDPGAPLPAELVSTEALAHFAATPFAAMLLTLLVAVPTAFVWQDRVSTLATELTSRAVGGGQLGLGVYISSGKLAVVQTDCLMLGCVWAGFASLRYVAGQAGHVLPGEAVGVLGEMLVLSYASHTSALDRSGVDTRGQKARFLDTHLVYYAGFAGPASACLRFAAHTAPTLAPPLFAASLAALTVASATLRKELAAPLHPSLGLLSLPHAAMSILFPSASGCGIS